MAIYPGSFDPVTNGHISLMERACHLFDTLTIAVSKSAGKSTMFTFEERLKMVKQASAEKKMACEVKVIGFEGLLAELAQREKAVYDAVTILGLSFFNNCQRRCPTWRKRRRPCPKKRSKNV